MRVRCRFRRGYLTRTASITWRAASAHQAAILPKSGIGDPFRRRACGTFHLMRPHQVGFARGSGRHPAWPARQAARADPARQGRAQKRSSPGGTYPGPRPGTLMGAATVTPWQASYSPSSVLLDFPLAVSGHGVAGLTWRRRRRSRRAAPPVDGHSAGPPAPGSDRKEFLID
jgi:hypothetical protein